MVFSSVIFIFFMLPLFILADNSIRCAGSVLGAHEYRYRNISLIIISLFFYIWGEAANVFILLGLGIVNYYAGKIIYNNGKRIIYFIVLNIFVLFCCKYVCWVISLILPFLELKQPKLPLGISFFTFHAISYLIDIRRGVIQPAKNAVDFLTYFCMFPHLVAGPIVRYAQVQHELTRRGPDASLFSYGVFRFLMGLNKKVLIANSVAGIADAAFVLSSQGHLHFLDAWLGIAAYTVQIYFDFSGYSDMAIGLAAMAGFHFEENFNRPYSSSSIREFWRRWHISLSSWLRDYLYIPLGGSRGSVLSTYRNQLVVFFICGLWHGADMTFIVWGLWHGIFLIVERMKAGALIAKLPSGLARAYVMLVVMLGWVFFRAENMAEAMTYMKTMFMPSCAPSVLSFYAMSMVVLMLAVVLCLIPDRFLPFSPVSEKKELSAGLYFCHAALAVISVSMLITSSRNPFIYFNF